LLADSTSQSYPIDGDQISLNDPFHVVLFLEYMEIILFLGFSSNSFVENISLETAGGLETAMNS